MKEKKFEVKEIKKAIRTIREYCNGFEGCESCDKEIKDWCISNIDDSEIPYKWEVDEDEE